MQEYEWEKEIARAINRQSRSIIGNHNSMEEVGRESATGFKGPQENLRYNTLGNLGMMKQNASRNIHPHRMPAGYSAG